MIILDREQHLGTKAFVVLLLGKTLPVIFLFFVSLIILALRGLIIKQLNGQIVSIGTANALVTASYIPRLVNTLSEGLFYLSLLIFTILLIVTMIEYQNYTFMVSEFALKLRKGFWDREEVSISYRQIQDINIKQGIIYQLIGLSRFIIDSSGHKEVEEQNETDIILEPLRKEVAEELFEMMQRKIGVQVVEGQAEADRQEALGAALPNITV